MDWAYALGIGLHTIAAIIWVGGMFFVMAALRPALVEIEPPARIRLMRAALPRFFAWVWVSVATLLGTGFGLILLGFHGGMAGPLHVHIMQATGVTMSVLFAWMFFVPWRRFRRAADAFDLPAAAGQLARIRAIVAVNLTLGLFTAFIGAVGTFFGY